MEMEWKKTHLNLVTIGHNCDRGRGWIEKLNNL